MAMAIAATGCTPLCSPVTATAAPSREHGCTTTASPRLAFPALGLNNRSLSRGSQKIDAKARRMTGASSLVTRAAALATEEAPAKADLSALKADLLAAVAGLDRGLVATEADEVIANSFAVKLEAACDPIMLPVDLDKLQGRWRLVFSSGFNTGSFGGQRPGPRISRLPLVSIGLVYQRIDVASRELDNIVDLNIPVPWPLPSIELTATLAHNFELVGGSMIKINYEKTILKATGGLSSLPPVEIPQIQLPDFVRTSRNRSGEFATTFIDKDLRISRGDRGELRIFVRS